MLRRIKLRQERVVTTDEARAKMAVEFSREVELGKVEEPSPAGMAPIATTTTLLSDTFREGLSTDAALAAFAGLTPNQFAFDRAREADLNTISIRGLGGCITVADPYMSSMRSNRPRLLTIENAQVHVYDDILTRSFIVSFSLQVVEGNGMANRQVVSVTMPREAASSPVVFIEELRQRITPLISDMLCDAVVPTLMSHATTAMQEVVSGRGRFV